MSSKSYGGLTSIPSDYILISAGAPAGNFDCHAECRGLLIGTAGFLNVTMKNGHVIANLPVQPGILPGFFASVQAGGTATSIWEVL